MKLIHEGNLVIGGRSEAESYRHLTEVTGGLYINADAKLDALTSVGGGLYIHADAKLDALTSVGGGLYIHDHKIVGDKFYVAQRGKRRA
jgi:prefoldin subunit 5